MSFQNLNLIEPLLKALNDEGYATPTPIQQQAIPIILERKDLLGCAQTGTGKTAAFALPLLQLLCEDAANPADGGHRGGPRPIRALILTPTRELAIQIDESFAAYGKYTGMKHLVIFGGVPQNPQVQALQRGTDILVATPGRLLDLSDQKLLDLRHIRYFVLDEADRMLDMGFINDVRKILTQLPAKKHSLFFSATMPPEIQKLANSILVNPSKVEVTPVSSTAETIQQSVYFVDKKDKRSLLLHVLKGSTIPTALVFTRTKHGADKVARGLTQAGIRAEAIHGNKSQNARQRALENFKSRHTRILVATDIAARGIDIDDLTHVINFELPNVPETYVHRIGRTGRAGASGTALSFCDGEEKEFLRDIQKLIARQIPVVEDHPHITYGGLSIETPVSQATGEANQANRGNRNGGQRDGRRNSGQQGGQHQRGRQNPGSQRLHNPGNGRHDGQSGHENRNSENRGSQVINELQDDVNENGQPESRREGRNDGRNEGRNGRGRNRGNRNGSQRPEQQHGRRGGQPEQRRDKQAINQPGQKRGEGQLEQEHGQPIASQPDQQRGRQAGDQPEQERGRQAEAQRENQPEQRREKPAHGQADTQRGRQQGPGQRPPRKNAGELKMPEAGKAYKDPTEGLNLKINQSDGDEKW